MRAQLVKIERFEIATIDKPVFRIGRERSYVDLCVADLVVSRSHCEIIHRDGHWYVRDCNSSNYTYVNGFRIPPNTDHCLSYGDEIMIANVRYRFEEVL